MNNNLNNLSERAVKILVFGFSLTSWKISYASSLKRMLEEAGRKIEIDIVGIGGVDAGFSAVQAGDYAKKKKYDLVILDVLARTGQASGLSSKPNFFMEAYKTTLAKVLETGAEPIVCEFYRETVDAANDEIFPRVVEFNNKNSIRTIDLATPVREMEADQRETLLVDTVHTTQQGADYYGNKLFSYLESENILDREKRPDRASLPKISATLHSAGIPGGALGYHTGTFLRTGYSTRFTSINENESLILNFRRERRVVGLLTLRGPLSGNILVGPVNRPAKLEICAYDRHCYFERSGMLLIPPLDTNSLVLTQLAGIPDIPLAKGEVVRDPRVAKVTHIVWANKSIDLNG